MKDTETIVRFIQLRAAGWSFARISEEIRVSKPTLIDWSRKHQFEIANLRALETEAMVERCLGSREQRWKQLGGQLSRVEAELARRDLSEVPTTRLLWLASKLRGEANREAGNPYFTTPTKAIPDDEYFTDVLNWEA